MVFVSPWVAEKTVIRSSNPNTPFDHTSWLATLLHWFDLDRSMLGARTACAPMFCDVIGDQKRPNIDLPQLADCNPDPHLEDKELTVELAEMISKYLKAANPKTDRLRVLKQMLMKSDTEKELYEFVREFGSTTDLTRYPPTPP